jgi:hypothetical protein
VFKFSLAVYVSFPVCSVRLCTLDEYTFLGGYLDKTFHCKFVLKVCCRMGAVGKHSMHLHTLYGLVECLSPSLVFSN